MCSYRYDQLNNYNWLYEQYVVNGLSTPDIATKIGAKSSNSVRQALLRHAIDVRSISDGLTRNRDGDGFIEKLDVLDGGLLGDASMSIWNKHSLISNPYWWRRNKFEEHVVWVAGLLGCGQERVKCESNWLKGKVFTSYLFTTLSHKSLRSYYQRWYPESHGFQKTVPEDIQINETVLLHWFLDDGHAERIRKTSKTKQVIIHFCSESFTRDEQEMLCEKIRGRFPITPRTYRYSQGTGWRIKIPQSESQIFYDIIGASPIRCFDYKWRFNYDQLR